MSPLFPSFGSFLPYNSLGEYGCIKPDRKFGEVQSLYSSDMTGVYSGGLVYEYTEEGSGYGLVKVQNDNVNELGDFQELKNAFAKTKPPSGDGGYKSNGAASKCPEKSQHWNVTIAHDQLPALPEGAADFFKNGAGKGPGLQGAGSQTSGSHETSLSSAADGAVTSGAGTGAKSPTQSKGAASSLRVDEFSMAPLVCGLVVVLSTLFGAALI